MQRILIHNSNNHKRLIDCIAGCALTHWGTRIELDESLPELWFAAGCQRLPNGELGLDVSAIHRYGPDPY